MTQIRDEFEKAYLTKPYGKEGDMNHFETALWAAKWMAEYSAKYFKTLGDFPVNAGYVTEELRSLSKGLGEWEQE